MNELVPHFFHDLYSMNPLLNETECELLVFGYIGRNAEKNWDLYVPFQLKQICKFYVIGRKGKSYCSICRLQRGYEPPTQTQNMNKRIPIQVEHDSPHVQRFCNHKNRAPSFKFSLNFHSKFY